MVRELELVLDIKATLGEGPCWDSKKQLLYWVDILEKRVYIFNPRTNENRCIQLNHYVGAIVPRNSGGAVLALEKGFYFLDTQTETLSLIDEPEKHIVNNRFNDGKCDANGRFWAGTMDKSYHKEQGALYCLNTNLAVKKQLSKVGLSNGLAWSPDNKFFYYIDTLTRKVVCFDFHLSTGEIENPREIIYFPEEEGMPDGMTIDEDGMLWIAHWGGSKVSRWNPKTGEQLTAIEVPALNVTSCTFGGKDLDELYITTARSGLNEDQLKEYPYSGGLFKIKTDVKGVQAYPFKG
ncbi:SMP-30/gluconolactonase/LRE family protein [Anaerobacillus alkaliphilus]|uniref:SMP-30/gluconolactonase/LRE family protein n=1 Tax=Anaerobacillus alkaliphilus TaxID=1548597 RepID=A0A4Q0W295_9BACI|nr:SMP-30/gluconolactonase/LRE family protein [Anaerobacillus alkaliphilus]RXJ04651.1 SMP-30/gluconolactonase/LRE family protein [Anaerobacillus alkaliphilus]